MSKYTYQLEYISKLMEEAVFTLTFNSLFCFTLLR
jgi:hypothetical protein